jgi:uncharacterized protein YabN with tetrapyrrole methylase and pyrophosphatase domain
VKKNWRLDVAYCFFTKIGSKTDDFDIADVCNEICEKLIHRHHIYAILLSRMKKKSNGTETKT